MTVEKPKLSIFQQVLLIATVVGGLAAFAGNIDSIFSTSSKWFGFPTPAKERVAPVSGSSLENNVGHNSSDVTGKRESFVSLYNQSKKLSLSTDRDQALWVIIIESLKSGFPDLAFKCANDLQLSTDREQAYWLVLQKSLDLKMFDLCGDVAGSFQFSTDRDKARTMIIVRGVKQ